MTITLESLLIPDFQTEGVVLEPIEAAMECGDAYMALCEAEQNCTTYEAAKIIKKNKSKSKKIKTTTSKMKAKDAKAKKAGGKVVKIKKVAKEADENLDGATGPTPTTTDTNGLTDTDLDADPDAEVEVTEVADEQPTEESAFYGMTEGVDFIVEYEDASILALEDEAQKQKTSFKEALKKFWEKIVKFFQSIAAKIDEFLNFDKKFIEKHKEAIQKGLQNPGNATLKVDKAYASDLAGTFANVMKTVKDELDDADSLIKGGATKEDVDAVKKEAKKEKVEEIKLSEVRASVDTLLKIVDSGRKEFKELYAKAKKAGAEATTAAAKADKENASKIRMAGAKYQRTISNAYREFGIIRSTASKIAHTAAKAGGAKTTEENK